MKNSLYVLPPGLEDAAKKMIMLTEVGRRPVMICGATGCGKSLMIHIGKVLFREKHGEKAGIHCVNCAMFGGDHNMVRSELFGHIRGAFSGAFHDKDGWIRKADGGLLVLDEIGEFPQSVQSTLLTFLDDGRFSKLGAAKTEYADTALIAATNNTQNLRDDFRHRFFALDVPAVCDRPFDIFCYIALKYPNVLSCLSPRELMSLLAYPWPGNVREIENVCEMLNIVPSLSSIERFAVSGIKLYLGLKEQGINVRDIENVLSDVRDEFSKQDIFETDPRFGFFVCKETETLKNAREKLRRFFAFISQNENSAFPKMTPPRSREDAGGYMSYDEIRKSYFKDLLAGCGYNQMKAAETAGINYTTFRSMLKKLGITEWLQSVKSESGSIPAAA